MTSAHLDVVGIGAQKSGTSTLDVLLRANPRIHLPQGKEVPVLHEPGVDAARWESYSRRVYGPVDGRLRGKVSPQYLQSAVAAETLERGFADARLVVVLRDPIARAASHYRMAVRRGDERRPFAVAVADQLARGLVPEHGGAETDAYVGWGRYGHWLGRYSRSLELGRLLVIWFDDLVADQAGVVRALATHLGIDEWPVGDADRVANASGRDGLVAATLRRARHLPGYDRVKRLVPADTRHAVAFSVEERSVRPYAEGDAPDTELPASAQTALVDLYMDDAILLRGLGVEPPWTGRWTADRHGDRP